ncbi:MAG: hypothetical protein JO335_04275 [Sphingomonas sp.]|nr:hypothetical protein [Sphingomonas sp.]
MKWDSLNVPVRIANLSTHGALVFGSRLPSQDQEVVLICGTVRIGGWIAWAGTSHAGINFDAPINLSDVLPKARTGTGAIVKDERVQDFRRPGFRGNQLSAEEQRLLEKWKRR